MFLRVTMATVILIVIRSPRRLDPNERISRREILKKTAAAAMVAAPGVCRCLARITACALAGLPPVLAASTS